MYTFDDNIFSDLHKDAYGFRPRSHEYWTASDDRKEEIWNGLLKELDAAIEREKMSERWAITKFENDLYDIEVLAGDRETAIRWFVESLKLDEIDLMYGGEKICYDLGLPFSMANIFNETCKKLLDNVEGIE